MNTSRMAQMHTFLTDNIGDNYQIHSLKADASFRQYHRIDMGNNQSYLLMDAPPQKESVQLFCDVANILKTVVNVPDILYQDIDNGFLLLQDFGDTQFADLIKQHKEKYYQQALVTLVDLQDLDIHQPFIQEIILPYSDKHYHDEMDLFSEWFLPFIGYTMSDDDQKTWQAFKRWLIEHIQAQPKVVVHRDYHSRNLMQDNSSNKLGVIDFQDALIGAYSYDLVSLIRDAYIDSDNAWVNTQIANFYQLANISQLQKSLDDFKIDVNMMGIQRHLKVLGIFVRLFERDNKDRYLPNIPKQWQDLNDELNDLLSYQMSEHDKHQLNSFYQFIQKITPLYHQKFGCA